MEALRQRCAHLEEVELSSGAARAHQKVFGEEEALPLALLLQGEGAQAHLTELPPLHRRQLD